MHRSPQAYKHRAPVSEHHNLQQRPLVALASLKAKWTPNRYLAYHGFEMQLRSITWITYIQPWSNISLHLLLCHLLLMTKGIHRPSTHV